MKQRPNARIMHTRITPDIRVSTAGIYRAEWHGSYYIVETWIFSDDPRQVNTQVIHGTPHRLDFYTLREAVKVHRYIADNLKERYN